MVDRHPLSSQSVSASPAPPASQSIDWYREGESRTVEMSGVKVTVRFVGRKGRRCRIAIIAPPGASFRALDFSEKLPNQTR
jgi:hypothetical protein